MNTLEAIITESQRERIIEVNLKTNYKPTLIRKFRKRKETKDWKKI